MSNTSSPRRKKAARARTGFDDFLDVLKKFRSLSVFALGGGVAVPFVAYLAKILPPWPPGVMLITGLLELVTLIVVFQFFRPAPRKVVNRVLAVTAPLLLIFSAAYLLLFA